MIGKRMKELRESRGLTQEDVGAALGVVGQQVYRWETEKNTPSPEMLGKIAQFFNVTTDYLLGLTNERVATENSLSPMERKLVAAVRSGQIHEALETLTVLTKK
jgi:transcriptional regulator with XRE-family HTH domain